jgi:hypothetical protein
MSLYVLVQLEEGWVAAATEHATGHPSLVVEGSGQTLSFQIASQPDGAHLAAQFARQMASSATKFADRCEELAQLWNRGTDLDRPKIN